MRAQAATDKGKSGGPLRAMMDVMSTEGVSGLYRGLNSTLFTLFFANFIYFYAFHLMRAFVSRNKRIRKLGKVICPHKKFSSRRHYGVSVHAPYNSRTLRLKGDAREILQASANKHFVNATVNAAVSQDLSRYVKSAVGHPRWRNQRLLCTTSVGCKRPLKAGR